MTQMFFKIAHKSSFAVTFSIEYGILKKSLSFSIWSCKNMSKFCIITIVILYHRVHDESIAVAKNPLASVAFSHFFLLFSLSLNLLQLLHFCSFLHHIYLTFTHKSINSVKNIRQYYVMTTCHQKPTWK